MPFEFFLEPLADTGFDRDAIEAMHSYLADLPSHQWADGAHVLFSSAAQRDRQLADMLAASGNDYSHAIVAVEPTEVMLSAVGVPETNQMMHDFVVWCCQRWPCALYEYDEQVDPEILLRAGS